MPRPRREPYYYRRAGKSGFYAFLDAKQKNISLGTDDEAVALERLAALVRDRRVRESNQPRPKAAHGKSFAEVCKTCWERARVDHTPKTAYGLSRRLRLILSWLSERSVYYVHQISGAVVEDYKAYLREKQFTAATVNRHLDAWKKAMKTAVDLGAVDETALRFFRKLREPRAEPGRAGMTKTQILKFLRAVDDKRYRALFRMVLGCGIRDDEARHLDAENIRRGELVVTPKPGWTSKSYRYRTIPISPATYKAAREYITAKPTMNLDSKGIWRRLNEACVAAEIPHYSMHDLRRAWASHMLASGCRIEDISRWLGHRDMMTTMRYLRVVSEAMPDRKKLPW